MAEKSTKSGKGSGRPCQKRYVGSKRSMLNGLLRAKRHERRLAYFQARRAAGKRNAYLVGRNGRDHHGRRVNA